MQSNNCVMRMHVLGDPDNKYTTNYLAPAAFISAIYKDGGRQYKCSHISNNTLPRAILLTLLDSNVDSDIKYVICHLQ